MLISKKVKHLGCHVFGNPACGNSKLLCEMWLRHCRFSQYQPVMNKTANGLNYKAILITAVLSNNF
jgi:hypothetical protein